MTNEAPAVPTEERTRLIAGVPAFSQWSPRICESLSELMREERFAAGATVVTEGEVGDRLYLIVEGRAEVTTGSDEGPVLVAALQSGELFGEQALLSETRRRQATVTAATPLLTLSLDAAALDRFLNLFPRAREKLMETGETRLIANFLKRASPFTRLDSAAVRRLAEQMKVMSMEAGTVIMRQGHRGDACCLLRSGRVEVLCVGEDGEERRMATLGPGAIIGESALLTDAPRNATVRALEPCDLLVLRRDDLLAAMGTHSAVGAEIMHLQQRRDRPRQAPDTEIQQSATPEGETIVTLKNRQNGAYYRLSPDGWLVWQRLDGQHTLAEIEEEYGATFGETSSRAVARIVQGLARAGFLQSTSLREDVTPLAVRRPWWQRLRQRR